MKAGFVTSSIAHAALIGFGLLSLSAPAPLEVGAVESLPVDIVPIEEITQIQQGERTAPMREQAAPTPTERPAPPEQESERIGEADVELDTPPTPEPTRRPVETAAAPPPAPTPTPVTRPEPEPAATPPAPSEPVPPPATERTATPEPAQPVEPEPAEQAAVAERPDPQAVQLPDQAPSPQARPQPPQAQTARAPERRQTERPAERPPQQRNTEQSDFNADDIAALLDRQKPSGGGTQRSTREAALGGRQTNTGSRLSQSEIDGLRGQVSRCWSPPVGVAEAENMIVSIRLKLTRSGELDGTPEVVAGDGSSMTGRAAVEAARRAVIRCAPYNAPADKYDAWADVQFNFDPRDMF